MESGSIPTTPTWRSSEPYKANPGHQVWGHRFTSAKMRDDRTVLARSLFSAQNRVRFSYSGRCGAMSRSKHTEAQMISAVKQMEAGRKAEDVAREVGVRTHTIYAWKSKYGGMDVTEAQEAKRLRDENARLKKLVADLSLDKEALQSVIEKNGWSSQR